MRGVFLGWLLVFPVLVWLLGAPGWAADEEFVGPFSTWTNVQTVYGAVGNGTADDTTALQTALNAVGTGSVHTLYFPVGTYKITSALTLTDKIYVRLIGADPATTILKWAGGTGTSMVVLNGVAYSSISRLTFDGDSIVTGAAINQRWDGDGGYFDTGNEYVDLLITKTRIGIQGGLLGYGFAETTIKRVHFLTLSYAGVALWDFNALDIYIWDSVFENCVTGVQNADGGAGSFRLYRNVFLGSTSADIKIYTTGTFSARDNVSIGSSQFFVGQPHSNPAPIVLQGNRIIDSTTNATISMENQGPLVLLDNTIRSKSGGTGPLVLHSVSPSTDTVTIGNVYGLPGGTGTPLSVGRLVTTGDTVVERTTLDASVPTMPGPALSMGRTVVDVAPGASAATIQAAIDTAVAAGNKAVVHLQAGIYTLSTPVTIPANADIQLIGDGMGQTWLRWDGATAGTILTITGPTKARVGQLSLRGDFGGPFDRGVAITGIDQVGAQVDLDRLLLTWGYDAHLVVNGVNHAKINLRDFGSTALASGTAVQVHGGLSRTAIFSGASSDNPLMYGVSDGGTLLVRDMWYETSFDYGFLALAHSQGTLHLESSRIATPAAGTVPEVAITSWQGAATFVGNHMDRTFVVSGDGTSTEFLGLGLLSTPTPYVLDTTSPAATAPLINSRYTSVESGSLAMANPGTIDLGYLVDQLALTRAERPGLVAETSAGVSDVRLQRVHTVWTQPAVVITGTSASPMSSVLRLVR